MAGNTATTLQPIMKELYDPKGIANVIYKDRPFLAMLNKNKSAVGEYVVHPVVYSSSAGRSASFSRAQTNAALTNEGVARFQIPMVENWQVGQIDVASVLQSQNNLGAFVKSAKLVMDDALNNLANDLSTCLFRSGSGAIGNVSASQTLSSSTLVLNVADDVVNFEIGDELVAAATETSGALRALGSAGHGLYVVAVDVDAGSVTIGTTPVAGGTPVAINDATNGIPTIGQSDFLFKRDDRVQGGTGKLVGLAGWNPTSVASSGDSFFNVNRFPSKARLAGQFLDGTSGGLLSDLLVTAGTKVKTQGGKLSHFWMSFNKMATLEKELTNKIRFVRTEVGAKDGAIGFEGIRIYCAGGEVVCMGDRSCPDTTIFGVNMESLELLSVGEPVQIYNLDNNGEWLRQSSNSGMETRLYSYSNLICRRPIDMINVSVNAG